MADFARDRAEATRVIGAKDILEESKILVNIRVDKVAVEVLKATYRIAALLYFR